MKTRSAVASDAAAIASVHQRGWLVGYADVLPAEFLATLDDVATRTRRWRKFIAAPDATVLVAVTDADLVHGFTSFGPNRDQMAKSVGELQSIYVDPDAWNLGTGSLLMQAALDGLAAAAFTSAILWTLEPNTRTRSFYEHRGWALDGTTRQHRSGASLVRYARALG